MDGDWVFSGNHDLRYSSRTKFRYSGKCGSKKPVRCSRLRSFNRRIPRNKRPCAQKCDGRRLGFLGNHDLRYSSTEPNLDTVGNVVLRNRSAVRVSGPLIAEFRGISALVPKNVMDGDWVFSATTTCAIQI